MRQIDQSSTHRCFVCGIDNPCGLKLKFFGDGEGTVWTDCIFTQDFEGYPGIVHGGIISSVLDETAGRAVLTHERPDFVLVTGKLIVNFRNPVKINTKIKVTGQVTRNNGRVIQARSWMQNEDGIVLADADVTLVKPGSELTDEIDPHEDQWVDWISNGGST